MNAQTEMVERDHDSAQSPAGAMMALIERAATSQDIDVDKLDRLLSVKERWDAAQAKQEFDRAMTDFRATVGPIRKTRATHNSKYAGLAETLAEIREKLTDCGLSVSWRTEQSENVVRVTCIVSHVAGHSEQTSLSSAPDDGGKMNSIQRIGSAVSYLERYTLFAILGLASGDQDDDGAKAAQDEADLIDAHTQADIEALVDEVLTTPQERVKFADWLKKSMKVQNGFIRNIPSQAADQVIAALEKKRGAK